MKKLIAALILATSVVPAKADYRQHCTWNRYSYTCSTTRIEPAPPIVYTEEELREMKAREDAWREYCKPVKVVTDDGLTRVQYLHPNCDIGAYRAK